METLLTTALEREIEAAQGETISLLKALCAIPAPSHHEERRARMDSGMAGKARAVR